MQGRETEAGSSAVVSIGRSSAVPCTDPLGKSDNLAHIFEGAKQMRTRSCFLLALSSALAHTLIADVLYNVTDLGVTLGTNNSVTDINNVGQVVGNSSGINARAFLYATAISPTSAR